MYEVYNYAYDWQNDLSLSIDCAETHMVPNLVHLWLCDKFSL